MSLKFYRRKCIKTPHLVDTLCSWYHLPLHISAPKCAGCIFDPTVATTYDHCQESVAFVRKIDTFFFEYICIIKCEWMSKWIFVLKFEQIFENTLCSDLKLRQTILDWYYCSFSNRSWLISASWYFNIFKIIF